MPPKAERQLEQDIAEVEEQRCGLQTPLISNPGGQMIPPLTRASCRELLMPSQQPSQERHPPTETVEELKETKRTLIPSFTTSRSEEKESADSTSQHTLKKEELDISITSFPSVEEQDPFE
uniref:Uncharacterized protein n=1 Tax=Moniliophthora roreri TaxID=221103 RepID=A0A0W0EYI0_MONRR